MKIVFMGTPAFAVPVLRRLMDTHTVLAVVTQPDRPVGRGHTLRFSPVKETAAAHGIPVLQPEKIRNKAFVAALQAFGADIFVVVAYGQLLPPSVLALPPLGCVNIHASLLPQYRGAAPMQHALINGDTVTGVTTMLMAKGMDTGDMLLKMELPIEPEYRFETLHDKLAGLSCDCIERTLALMAAGTLTPTPQVHEQATYAPMLTRETGHIQWETLQTHRIINLTRALDPWPGTYAFYQGQPIKLWRCEPEPLAAECFASAVPGTILAADASSGLRIKTVDGALRVTEMQGSGGKRMPPRDYLRGHAMTTGVVLT